MVLLVKSIGVFLVFVGVLLILNPGTMRKMVSFWRQGRRLYAAGVIRVLFGMLFLSASSQARAAWVIYAIGILMLLGGMGIFIMGLDRIKAFLERVDKKPVPVLRLMALPVLVIGLLVIYCA